MRQAIHDNITPSKSENTTRRQAPSASDSEAITRSDMMNMTVKMSALASASTAILEKTLDPATSACPVAALAVEYENLAKLWDRYDDGVHQIDKDRFNQIVDERMLAICDTVSYMAPTSDVGVAFQVMVAHSDVGTLSSHVGDACAGIQLRIERLLYNVVNQVRGNSEVLPNSYEHMMRDELSPHQQLRRLLGQSEPELPAVPMREIETGRPAQSGERLVAQAALARMKEAVRLLTSSYVCEGWRIDSESASNALSHFTKLAAGEEDEDGAQVALDFVIQHGLSLDWLMSGDPSNLICEGAARSLRAAHCSEHLDRPLVEAQRRVTDLDAELSALMKQKGDDADSDPVYERLEADRFAAIDTLSETSARGWEGVKAKATALKIRSIAEDYERTSAIAESLADDVLRLSANS